MKHRHLQNVLTLLARRTCDSGIMLNAAKRNSA